MRVPGQLGVERQVYIPTLFLKPVLTIESRHPRLPRCCHTQNCAGHAEGPQS